MNITEALIQELEFEEQQNQIAALDDLTAALAQYGKRLAELKQDIRDLNAMYQADLIKKNFEAGIGPNDYLSANE